MQSGGSAAGPCCPAPAWLEAVRAVGGSPWHLFLHGHRGFWALLKLALAGALTAPVLENRAALSPSAACLRPLDWHGLTDWVTSAFADLAESSPGFTLAPLPAGEALLDA